MHKSQPLASLPHPVFNLTEKADPYLGFEDNLGEIEKKKTVVNVQISLESAAFEH